MKSLRGRLLVGTAVATVAILLIAGVMLYVLTRRFLISEFDTGLRARIGAIASMLEFEPLAGRLDAEDAQQMPEFQPGRGAEYFQITSRDGKHIVLSPSLHNRLLEIPGGDTAADSARGFVTLPDGRRGRVMQVSARTRPDEEHAALAGPDVIITVAKGTESLDRVLSRLRLLLAAICGGATLALATLCAWTIRSALRPVHKLARQIGAIGANDLSERIEGPGIPLELQPLIARLNELLAKLQQAFDRERAFTADAAHELRTPLSALQTAMEVCARESREPAHYRRIVGDCLHVVRQMNAMVDNLLLLARADGKQIPVQIERFDVATMLSQCWSSFRQLASDRGVSVEWRVDEGVALQSDPDKLRMILNNLLENAARYVNEGGRIEVGCTARDSQLELLVANTGSALGEGDMPRVFDRFWRSDASRAAAGRHCGLGLAVCSKLVAVLGGSIAARCPTPGVFEIRVTLPGASVATAPLEPACSP